MKKITAIILFALALSATAAVNAEAKIINRYNMTLTKNDDGSYSISDACLKLLNGAVPEGLTEPYTPVHPVHTKDVAYVKVDTVVYKSYGNRDLHLYICRAGGKEKTPCVFFCHGGSWRAGNPSSMLKFAKWMASREGITSVSLQYSLSRVDGVLLENSIQDYMDAISYVQEHSSELNVDPDRLGFVGHSAGGHLSSLAAMKCPQSKALVSWAGVYDLNKVKLFKKDSDKAAKLYEERYRYSKGFDKEYLAENSPLYVIPTERCIAVMLFFGGCDVLVPTFQALTFGPALEKAGHKVSMEYYEYYGHGMHSSSDKATEIWKKTIDFLKSNL